MIAVNYKEEQRYGCPNCGCDSWKRDNVIISNQPAGTCVHCNLYYQIFGEGVKESSIKYNTGRLKEDGTPIMESAILIPHPRKGIPKWKYELPDIRPEYGEYWKSRGVGYDLAGFVKSKQAGERIREMVKEVLGKEKPDSWLDYRKNEPFWIQFKFQKSEFDLKKLDNMTVQNNGIVTKEILEKCKKTKMEDQANEENI